MKSHHLTHAFCAVLLAASGLIGLGCSHQSSDAASAAADLSGGQADGGVHGKSGQHGGDQDGVADEAQNPDAAADQDQNADEAADQDQNADEDKNADESADGGDDDQGDQGDDDQGADEAAGDQGKPDGGGGHGKKP